MTAGLVAGCGSPQINRIDKNREIYESWPIETRQAILDGKVEPGMTPDMVLVAWGQPSEKVDHSSAAGDEEIWIYRKGGDNGAMMAPMGGGAMYPGGMYPGAMYPGGIYPGGMYPGNVMGGPGVGVSMGRGGTSIGSGIGMGGPIMGGGMPVAVTQPTPVEEREVVFRQGVVYRADAP